MIIFECLEAMESIKTGARSAPGQILGMQMADRGELNGNPWILLRGRGGIVFESRHIRKPAEANNFNLSLARSESGKQKEELGRT